MVNLDRVKLADAISRGVLSISASSVSGFRVQSGPVLVIPGLPELATVIEASLSGKLTFLITEQGKPFSAAGFSNWFRNRCNGADLPHCSAHGLRKAICRRLVEHGATSIQIAAITGPRHRGSSTITPPPREQSMLARAAMARITGT